MDITTFDKKRLRKASLALAIIFALMLVFTILSWGVASDWGDIQITRINFIGDGGASQSALMFVPKGVTVENPAPAIINFHGRNCSSYSMINWAIEEARRGYVVINPDRARTNESVNTVDNSDANIIYSAYNYMKSLGIVTEISATGHSAGTGSLNTLVANEQIKSELKSVVAVGGFFTYGIRPEATIPTGVNWCIIEGKADLYANQWYKSYDAEMARLKELTTAYDNFQMNTLYGSFEDNTAFEYIEYPVTHQQEMYNGDVIGSILTFVGSNSPAPISLDNTDMVFRAFQFFSAVCSILFIFFVGSLAYTFTCLPIFYSITTVPLIPSNGKSAKSWVIQVAKDYLIPIALFIPVTNWAAKASTAIFKSVWVNQIFFWIVSSAIVGAIIIAIKYFNKNKTDKLTALDFGTGAAEEKIVSWSRIITAFSITIMAVFLAFNWLDIVVKLFGVNYQFYDLFGQINRLTPQRIIYIIPYLIVCIFLVFVINVNIATSRRMKTTGNETRDMIRDIVVKIILSAGPLTLLMAIEFIGVRLLGSGAQPFDSKYWGSLSFGFMFPLMMSSSAGISTFLYRKTGNIWTGVFTSSFTLIFITMINACISA